MLSSDKQFILDCLEVCKFYSNTLLVVPINGWYGACVTVTEDMVEESVSETKVATAKEAETMSKDAGAEDEDMEVIDDLEDGSEGSNASVEEDFSEGDELTGSATPSSSASSKSGSGLCPE